MNVSVPIPTPYTGTFLGVGGSVTADRYGHSYASLNAVAGFPSAAGASVMVGYINSITRPSASLLSDILSSWGGGFSGGFIAGGGFYGNQSGTATSVGLTTPGVSLYGGYTWQLPVSTPTWCH